MNVRKVSLNLAYLAVWYAITVVIMMTTQRLVKVQWQEIQGVSIICTALGVVFSLRFRVYAATALIGIALSIELSSLIIASIFDRRAVEHLEGGYALLIASTVSLLLGIFIAMRAKRVTSTAAAA